jgi:trans-aconitate 2-methyltransferase
MNDWDPNAYLQFRNERAQPAIDLVEKIELYCPKNIIDIGCGPGNSTQILAAKWPDSVITGLDSSIAMIEKARNDYPHQLWLHTNAENIDADKKYSLVFSNAALQWMDNHETLIPKLWEIVNKNGAFAVQIPKFEKMPISDVINKVIDSDKWYKRMNGEIFRFELHELDYYYDLLSPFTDNIILWETHYFHILPSLQGIIDFIQSTALKPYLEKLNIDTEKRALKNDILKECQNCYRIQSNGRVLFPFKRMFIIAYKK